MTDGELGVWHAFFVVGIGLLGLLIGSFLNVVVYRVPNGLSVVSPPSACPKCDSQIRSRDNIPVLSWLILRGKCRDCGAAISPRYPAVEAVTGAIFVLFALVWWPRVSAAESATATAGVVIELVAFLYLAAVGVALFLIDLDTRRLPNAIVVPSFVVGAVLLSASAILTGRLDSLIAAAIGAVALFAFYLILALAYPGGMGFGDVKLAAVLGLYLAWLGWGALVVGAFAAFLLGGIFAVALIIVRKAGRKSGIPFGPWMILGSGVGVFFGQAIAESYLTLFGLN